MRLPPQAAGRRLDQALADAWPEYSRSRLKRWIDEGWLRVDGRVPKPRERVAGGERVLLDAPVEDAVAPAAEPIPLAIAWEDDDVLVVNKPAGLVVHPGAGNPAGTLQNALLAHDARLARLPRAGIVHRLDKDTTGLLIVARNEPARAALTESLAARDVHREYQAVCVGVMTAGGTVDAPIDRHPVRRQRMAVRSDGREAVTHYRVLERFRRHTLVRALLETGRTHQIRLHLAHAGYPLVGDPVYGGRLVLPKGATPRAGAALRAFRRQALHAAALEFPHPSDGRRIRVTAPLPADMAALVEALRDDARAASG
jgi:23S rRNA pseudouridine1911/1915/1917 synthase